MPKPKMSAPQAPPSESSEEEEIEDGPGGFDMERLDPNYSRKFIAKLPAEVRARVTALQGMDATYMELINAHSAAERELERKYEELARPLFARRREIVLGASEATEAEVAKGYPDDHKGHVSLTDGPASTEKGLPDFWLNVLRHHVVIDDMVTERDEEALHALEDVTYTMLPAPAIGFTIAFHFADNEFFTNKVLSKTFHTREIDHQTVLDKAESSGIDWKPNKSLVVKTVSKKTKNAKTKAVKYTTSTEPCESFFHFFLVSDDKEQEADDEEQFYAMAETLRDKLIPHAVEYYTGEAPDGSSDIMSDEEGDEEEEEEEEESEEEPAPPPKKGGKGVAAVGPAPAPAPAPKGKGAAPAPGGKKGGAAAGQQPECKQQ